MKDLPNNLPPLPPVPPGFDRWEYRGRAWRSVEQCEFRICGAEHPQQDRWREDAMQQSPLGRDWLHYIEAVREPATTAEDHANDLREFLEVMREPAKEMKPMVAPLDPEVGSASSLARRFHDTYERLAPQFGYETRTDTKSFDPDTPNGRLMTAVCAEVMNGFTIQLRDQPASGDLLAMEPDGYIDALASSATGVEARVCEGWQATMSRVAAMSREEVAAAIAAHSPWESKRTDVCAADDLAMTLIHLRHDKREIVNLIRWCLMGCPQPPEGGPEKP